MLGTLLVALAAAVALASPAMAKGGGGGGGGGGAATPGCAVIQGWTNTVETSTITGAPVVVMRFDVFNGCVDELGASRAMFTVDTYDTATGKWLTGFGQGDNLGLQHFAYSEPYTSVAAAAPQTVVVSVSRINGQVQDSRTFTLAQLMQMVQAPAA
jgi:hypothetical protein